MGTIYHFLKQIKINKKMKVKKRPIEMTKKAYRHIEEQIAKQSGKLAFTKQFQFLENQVHQFYLINDLVITFMSKYIKENNTIQSLYIYQGELTDRQLGRISCQPIKYKSLQLSFNNLTSKCGKTIKFMNFCQLEELSLKGNQLQDDFLFQMKDLSFMMLNKLNLSKNKLSKMISLIECQILNLKQLYIQNNMINNEGINQIAKGRWMNLNILCLDKNYITSDGLKSLSKIQCKQLQRITISQNYLFDRALEYMSFGYFQKLKLLDISNSQCFSHVANLVKFNQESHLYVNLFDNFNNQKFKSSNSVLRENVLDMISKINIKINYS